MKWFLPLLCILLTLSCNELQHKKDLLITKVNFIEHSPTIDGEANETIWKSLAWHPLSQNLEDETNHNSDFIGKYKLAWNENGIYILMEIVDDHLYDETTDPLKNWWKDDAIKIFIDEDNSGGLHHYSYNAFAYNIDLNGNVVDLAPDKKPKFYNDHVLSKHVRKGKITQWELQVKVFSDKYRDGGIMPPVTLIPNKKIGFAIEYMDNDYRLDRQNHYASLFVPGEDEKQGWIDADIFGTLVLIKN